MQKPELYIKEEPIEQSEGFDYYSSDSENRDNEDDDDDYDDDDDDEDYGLPENDNSSKVKFQIAKLFFHVFPNDIFVSSRIEKAQQRI